MNTYAVLYSNQKTKKHKTWKDGKLKLINKKIVLIGEDGKILDSRFLQNGEQIEIGSELEMDMHFVQIDSLLSSNSSSTNVNNGPSSTSTSPVDSTAKSIKSTPSFLENPLKKRKLNGGGIVRKVPYGVNQFVEKTSTSLSYKSKSGFSPPSKLSSPPGPLQPKNASLFPLETPLVAELIDDLPVGGRSDNEILELLMQPSSSSNLSKTQQDLPSMNSNLPKNSPSLSKKKADEVQELLEGINEEEFQIDENFIFDEKPNKNNSSSKIPLVHSLPKIPTPEERLPSKNFKPPPPNLLTFDSFSNSQQPSVARSLLLQFKSSDTATKTEPKRRVGLSKGNSFSPPSKQTTSQISNLNHNSNLTNHIKQSTNSNHLNSFKAPPPSVGLNQNSGIIFPDLKACTPYLSGMPLANKLPSLTKKVPDSFQNVLEYRTIWTQALHEELNSNLFKLAVSYHSLCQQLFSNQQGAPNCKHGPTVMKTCKNTNNKGKQFYVCPKTDKTKCNFFKWVDELPGSKQPKSIIQQYHLRESDLNFLRSEEIKIYADCELIRTSPTEKKLNPKKVQNSNSLYLKLTWKEPSGAYSKDDIWIICSDATFSPSPSRSKTLSIENIFLAKSVFHGPARSGLLEIKFLNDRKHIPNQKYYAIRGPNASSELAMTDNLKTIQESQLPILPFLLHGIHSKFGPLPINPFKLDINFQQLKDISTEITKKHNLNQDQTQVLEACIGWFETLDKAPTIPPILLVHGVFGSGKSYLLVTLILFLVQVFQTVKNPLGKILICSATNVAVDRILLGLLQEGFTTFVRVGSLKKIAKPLLDFTLQSSDDKETLQDLKAMLREPHLSNSEFNKIMKSIEAVETGEMRRREQQLKEVPVVGVTCAASIFPVLDNSFFPIVFLDESSQMLEPMSLVPLSRFKCMRLLAAGDPMQLSPTLSSFAEENIAEEGLAKTLFVRLTSIGFQPIMLKTQYRCHPQLTKIPNQMFYSNLLKDGVSEKDCPPVIPNLPPLMVCNDEKGVEIRNRGGSYLNEFEADTVVKIISILLSNKVKPHQIGVIALYKAQVGKIMEKLNNLQVDPSWNTEKTSNEGEEEDEEELLLDEEEEKKLRSAKKKNCSGLRDIQISTVDAFQGAEKDVILLACSRTTKLGFSDSPKRLNVALTRAKKNLIILGKVSVLSEDKLWKAVIHHAQIIERGLQSCLHILSNGDFSPSSISPYVASSFQTTPLVPNQLPLTLNSLAPSLSNSVNPSSHFLIDFDQEMKLLMEAEAQEASQSIQEEILFNEKEEEVEEDRENFSEFRKYSLNVLEDEKEEKEELPFAPYQERNEEDNLDVLEEEGRRESGKKEFETEDPQLSLGSEANFQQQTFQKNNSPQQSTSNFSLELDNFLEEEEGEEN